MVMFHSYVGLPEGNLTIMLKSVRGLKSLATLWTCHAPPHAGRVQNTTSTHSVFHEGARGLQCGGLALRRGPLPRKRDSAPWLCRLPCPVSCWYCGLGDSTWALSLCWLQLFKKFGNPRHCDWNRTGHVWWLQFLSGPEHSKGFEKHWKEDLYWLHLFDKTCHPPLSDRNRGVRICGLQLFEEPEPPRVCDEHWA